MTMREALYGATLAYQFAAEAGDNPEGFWIETPTCLNGNFVEDYNSKPLEYLEEYTENILINDGHIVGLRYVV